MCVCVRVPMRGGVSLMLSMCWAGVGRCLQEQSRPDRRGSHLRGAEEERHRVPHGRPGRPVTHTHTAAGERSLNAHFHALHVRHCSHDTLHHCLSSLATQSFTSLCGLSVHLHMYVVCVSISMICPFRNRVNMED